MDRLHNKHARSSNSVLVMKSIDHLITIPVDSYVTSGPSGLKKLLAKIFQVDCKNLGEGERERGRETEREGDSGHCHLFVLSQTVVIVDGDESSAFV